MPVPTTPLQAARPALEALIDYAGLFPPSQLALPEALAEYAAARNGAHAWLLGRFVAPAEAVPHVRGLPLSVIVQSGRDARGWLDTVQRSLQDVSKLKSEGDVQIEALEVALPALSTLRETYDASIGQFAAAAAQAGLNRVRSFVELPRDKQGEELLTGALRAMGRHGLCAKLRCGGVQAESVPTVSEVAAFVHGAVSNRVAFKATAGLHHPVRGYDESRGFVTHGFLNILAASAIARSGGSREDLAGILEDDDAGHFRFAADGLHCGARVLPVDLLQETRQDFLSYGSCSFDEPVADLQSLEIIP